MKTFTQIEIENAGYSIHGYAFDKDKSGFEKAKKECIAAMRRDLEGVESITFEKYQQLKRLKRF